MSLSETPIVVLGMFRSGTSSVAGALSQLGVFLGEESAFHPTDEFNQGGYWELMEMMELNRRCLASYFMTSMQARALPDNWRDAPEAEFWIGKVQELLQRHYAGRKVWGWKEPQTCVLMPIYKEALLRLGLKPHYIICVRNPLDVMASQREFGALPVIGRRALGLWIHYTLSSLCETAGESRSVVVYEDFLVDPRRCLQHAVDAIPGFEPDDDAWVNACASVRPSLSHSRTPIEGLEAHPVLLRRTYELCAEAAHDASAFVSGALDARIEELWEEWCEWSEMVYRNDLPHGILTLTWQPGDQPIQAKTPFAPAGEWQTVRVNADAPGDCPMRVHLYHVPSQIWIRRATWRHEGIETPVQLLPGPNGALDSSGGFKRLRVFGPDHLRTITPKGSGPFELEVEILLQSNSFVSNEIVTLLRQQMERMRQMIGHTAPGNIPKVR